MNMNTIAKAGMKLMCQLRYELGQTCPEVVQKLETSLDDLLYLVAREIEQTDELALAQCSYVVETAPFGDCERQQ